MAAIQEVSLPIGIDKGLVTDALWAWIDAHRDQKVWTVSFWFIKKTFTINDLRPVFALILGPDPMGY